MLLVGALCLSLPVLAAPVAAVTRPATDPTRDRAVAQAVDRAAAGPGRPVPEVEVFPDASAPLPPRPAARATAPLSQTFLLHSRPSASRTVYLDFDGYDLPSGSAWVGDEFPAGHYDGWSIDGDHTAFSDAERAIVQQVWGRVAEDFAPFEVDQVVDRSRPGRRRQR